MKKYLPLFLVIVMLLLTACGSDQFDSITVTKDTENPVLETQDRTTNTDETRNTVPSGSSGTGEISPDTEPSQENPTNPSDETEPTSSKEDSEPTKPPKGNPETTKPTNPPETTPEPTEKPSDYTLKLSTSSVSMEVGESKNVTVTYTGSGNLTWSSSNSGVAKVSNGKITGVAAGTAYVTVSDGTKNATVAVTVKAKPVETQPPTQPTNPTAELKILTTKAEVTAGNTYQVEYTYTGNTSNLTWTSNDTSVATVNGSGVVTAVGAGQALIKVTDGTTTKRCTITVVAPPTVYATSIELRGDGQMYDGVTKVVGESYSGSMVVKPNEANQTVNVSSSNSSVVSVSSSFSGGFAHVSMNFKNAGTATITFTSGDGAVSMSYTITVQDKEPVSSSELSPEAFASTIEQTLVANGFTVDRSCNSWIQGTYSAAELTSANAYSVGYGWAKEWWDVGVRYCNIQYVGQNADGNYVFHLSRC